MSMQQWQEFLEKSNQPASITALSALSDNADILCDLSHLGLLKLEGADRINFLQGQVTNDVKLLDGSHAHLSGYCSPKGRLLALFLAFNHSDHLYLQLPKTLTDPIAKRLKMFVLRSQVTITDASDTLIKIGIAGQHAESRLKALYNILPAKPYDMVTHNNTIIIRLPGNTARFEILTDCDQAKSIWEALSPHARFVEASAWDLLDIHAGIPEIYPDTQEQFVPQMVNLDLLHGINFKKGCYTGQEIVARTHYLGTVKRRTLLAHLPNSIAAPVPGKAILNAQQEAIGQVVRSARNSESDYDLLIEIRIENKDSEAISIDGHALQIKTLPYAV